MAERAPEALLAQVRAAHSVTVSARDYFIQPSLERASVASERRLDAQRTRAAADRFIEGATGRKTEWLELSAAAAELADEAAWAVEEHQRFEVKLGTVGERLARLLESAAARLCEALRRLDEAQTPLAEAKSKALQIEDLRRRAREAALARPELAAELSARAVLDRFSKAAECVHRAADALAESIGGRA